MNPVKLPHRIGRYPVRRLLGTSARETVFLAHDPIRDRPVEIALLPLNLPTSASERVTALTGLEHPGIQRTYEQGVHQSWRYVVRERISGETLTAVLARERLDDRAAVRIALALADALGAAHRLGVHHGRLTPDSILVEAGSARLRGFAAVEPLSSLPEAPHCLAPEQIVVGQRPPDHRSDVYSLGCLLHWLLLGRPPHTGRGPARIADAILHRPILPPGMRRPGLPRALESILLRCLDRRPERRHQSMPALAADLRAWLDGRPVPLARRRTGRALARRCLPLLLLGAALTFLVGLLESRPSTAILQERVVDRLMRAQPTHHLAPEICFVGFDEQPVPKPLLAEVLGRVLADRPAALLVDVHLDNPKFLSDPERARLARVAGRSRRVVLAHRVVSRTFGGDVQAITALAPLDQIRHGFTNLQLDGDGVVRRMRFSRPELPSQDAYSLSVRTLLVAGRLPRRPPGFLRADGTFRIHFPAQRQAFDSRMIPARQLLEGRPHRSFADRIVLVGFVATRPEVRVDVLPTPTSDRLPGMYIHGAAIDTLIQGPWVRTVPEPLRQGLLLVCLSGLLLTSALLRLTVRPARPSWLLPLGLSLLVPVGYLIAAVELYRAGGWLLGLLYPVAALLLALPLEALCRFELERHRVRWLARRLRLPEP